MAGLSELVVIGTAFMRRLTMPEKIPPPGAGIDDSGKSGEGLKVWYSKG